MDDRKPTRRRVLELCGRAAIAAAALPPLATLVGCPTDPPDETPDDEGWLTLALADYPELAAAGGMAVVEVPDAGLSIAVGRGEDDSFAAIDAICSHAQCTLDSFDEGARAFACPCHGSSFGDDGAVITGPATVDLTAYPTEYDPDADAVRVQVA